MRARRRSLVVATLAVTAAAALAGASPHAAVDPTNAFKAVIVGPGNVENSARSVVRTADGRVYIFASDDTAQRLGTGPGVARAWKGNVTGIPTAFSEVDGAHRPTAGTNTNVIIDVDARLDSAGTVHVVYVDETTQTLYYRTFSTLTDTWGAPSAVATGISVPDGYFRSLKRARDAVTIALDGNDVPTIVYSTGPTNAGTELWSVTKTGSGWTAPQLVTGSGRQVHPQLAYGPDGSLHLSWLNDAPTIAVMYARLPPGGTWSAPEVVNNTDVQGNDTGDQGPSIVVTSSGTPYTLWISPVGGANGSGVRIAYRAADGTWTNDPLPANLYTHAPQIYGQNGDIYAFLGHDDQIRLGYEYQLAGQPWSPYRAFTTLADGTLDGSASIRWDPLHETDASVIDGAFFDEDKLNDGTYQAQLYYVGVTSSGAGAPPPPPGDTTPPTVSVSAPAAGSTVSGTTGVTASATDDVGVASVQLQIDGVNLGPPVSSAPYSAVWDTTTVANGTHTVGAVAADAAGNTSTATAVVTVSNAAPPPPPSGLVAAYSFDAGSGTTLSDSSGKGNNGTIAGAAWTTGHAGGGALSFDGASSSVTIPDAGSLDVTSGMTLEAWVDPAALGTAWATVLFKERTGGVVYSLYANQNTSVPVGQVYIGGERNATGTSQLPLNTWTHLTATYDGAALKLYVNGTLVRSVAQSGSMTASTGPLRIGGNSIWGEYFKGAIDDVRVYNRALSAAEIQTDMGTPVGTPQQPPPPPPPPPPSDTTPPTVSISAPAAGATLAGTQTVSAAASDDVGVAGVQFALDGTALGAEVTAAPYAVSWDTTTAAAGSHTLTAVARDAAGNRTTSAGVPVTVSNTGTVSGLVAAYGFNEGTGTTVKDVSGRANNGTAASTTWSTAGKYGGALSFNGTSSWVTVPDSASLHLTTGMTLEAWVNPSALGSQWRCVLFKEQPGDTVYSLYAHDGSRPQGQIFNGGAERKVVGTALVAGKWTHLAVTYDGTTLRLYVNGALSGSTTVGGAIQTSTGVLHIGGDAVWGERFQGLIDEVRIYNRALTQAQVQTDMNTAVK